MTTYYRNEYLFSEIYLQEITQQPEDTEILASLTTLKEYREFARTATIQEWKESFVHEVLYALRFNIKIENERLTLLYPVGNMETPLTLCSARCNSIISKDNHVDGPEARLSFAGFTLTAPILTEGRSGRPLQVPHKQAAIYHPLVAQPPLESQRQQNAEGGQQPVHDEAQHNHDADC